MDGLGNASNRLRYSMEAMIMPVVVRPRPICVRMKTKRTNSATQQRKTEHGHLPAKSMRSGCINSMWLLQQRLKLATFPSVTLQLLAKSWTNLHTATSIIHHLLCPRFLPLHRSKQDNRTRSVAQRTASSSQGTCCLCDTLPQRPKVCPGLSPICGGPHSRLSFIPSNVLFCKLLQRRISFQAFSALLTDESCHGYKMEASGHVASHPR